MGYEGAVSSYCCAISAPAVIDAKRATLFLRNVFGPRFARFDLRAAGRPSKTKARIARYSVAASHFRQENAHVGHPSHPH